MALVLADRVKETSTTTGTGTYDLAGPETGFQGFVAGIGDGNTTYYFAEDGTDWEVGIGTVTDAATDTLARTAILSSSNSGSAVNWGAGTKNIGCGLPASRGKRTSIATNTTTGAGAWTFSSIPQGYDNLYLRSVITGDGSYNGMLFEFSNDNGSSWSSTLAVTQTNASQTYYNDIWIFNYTADDGFLLVRSSLGGPSSLGTDTSNIATFYSWGATGGIDAIRLSIGAGTLTANNMELFGE